MCYIYIYTFSWTHCSKHESYRYVAWVASPVPFPRHSFFAYSYSFGRTKWLRLDATFTWGHSNKNKHPVVNPATKQTCFPIVPVRSSSTWSSSQGLPIFPSAWRVLIIIPEALMSSTMSNCLQERVILWNCVTHLAMGSLSSLLFLGNPWWILVGWCLNMFLQLSFGVDAINQNWSNFPFTCFPMFSPTTSDHCRIR